MIPKNEQHRSNIVVSVVSEMVDLCFIRCNWNAHTTGDKTRSASVGGWGAVWGPREMASCGLGRFRWPSPILANLIRFQSHKLVLQLPRASAPIFWSWCWRLVRTQRWDCVKLPRAHYHRFNGSKKQYYSYAWQSVKIKIQTSIPRLLAWLAF